MTLYIAISLICGILFGYFIIPDSSFMNIDIFITISLNILVFSVGIDIGTNKGIFKDILHKGFKILLVPFTIIIGTLLGGVLAGLIFKYSLNVSMAIAAGFGWYSLSGILLTEIANAELGTIAFLSNVFRELITLLLIPILAKKLNYLAVIAPAGATSMDSTLPIIAEETDEETVVIAFVNGVILSALVPILVPFLYNLGC